MVTLEIIYQRFLLNKFHSKQKIRKIPIVTTKKEVKLRNLVLSNQNFHINCTFLEVF